LVHLKIRFFQIAKYSEPVVLPLNFILKMMQLMVDCPELIIDIDFPNASFPQ
jgi:hypothetical protein